jgi:hypothetical protein
MAEARAWQHHVVSERWRRSISLRQATTNAWALAVDPETSSPRAAGEGQPAGNITPVRGGNQIDRRRGRGHLPVSAATRQRPVSSTRPAAIAVYFNFFPMVPLIQSVTLDVRADAIIAP